MENKIIYTIDGVDISTLGVYVSSSDGVISKPKLKAPLSVSWNDYHGQSVDLQHKYYEARTITLNCFIHAANKMDFMQQVLEFEKLFDAAGTQRLMIDVPDCDPLVYEVYCNEGIAVKKTWRSHDMTGTFQLKLVEPEPVKRVLVHKVSDITTDKCTIAINTSKMVNIFWGDGEVDYDVCGNITVHHSYATTGTYYPVVTGCIDEINSFDSNATIVWNKL